MKNFVSPCFIVLLFLCSCKSNSFLTQRYTNYGHSSHKHTKNTVVTTKAVKKSENASTVAVQPVSELLAEFETPVATSAAEHPVTKHSKHFVLREKLIDPALQASSRHFSLLKSEIEKNRSQQVESKKHSGNTCIGWPDFLIHCLRSCCFRSSWLFSWPSSLFLFLPDRVIISSKDVIFIFWKAETGLTEMAQN